MATTKKGNGLYAGEYKAAKGSNEMEALVRSLVRSQDGGLEGVSGIGGTGRRKYKNRYKAALTAQIMGTQSSSKKVRALQKGTALNQSIGGYEGRPSQYGSGYRDPYGSYMRSDSALNMANLKGRYKKQAGTPTVNKSAMDDALRAAIAQGPEAGSTGDHFDSFEAFQANTPEGYSSSYKTVYKQKAVLGSYAPTYEDTNEVDDNLTAIAKRAEYRRWQNNNSAYTAKVNASRGGVTGQVQSNYNPYED